MALYRCGGGVDSPTLISKNITANGTYNAVDDNADGYSSVNVSVSGSVSINTQAQWDALTFAQKKAQGLTVIRNAITEASGIWRDMTRAAVDIIKEFFASASETVFLNPQSLNHLIYFQGQWKDGGSHDCAVITQSNVSYDSVDTGIITVDYTGFNNRMISILHDVTVGNNAAITVRNGYGGVTDGGAVIGVPYSSDVELIGEYFGSSSQTFVTDKAYDFVLFLSNKWDYLGGTSNGVYSISDGTLIQVGGMTLEYSGSDNHMTAVYESVPAGTTITLGNGRSGVLDSVVAIGINAN